MRHGVEDDVDAHGIGFFDAEFLEEPFVGAFFFPAVGEIAVGNDQDHEAVFVIIDAAEERLFGIFAFPCDALVAVADGDFHFGNLGLGLQVVDAME